MGLDGSVNVSSKNKAFLAIPPTVYASVPHYAPRRFHEIVPALHVSNMVVIKPSEYASIGTLKVVRLTNEVPWLTTAGREMVDGGTRLRIVCAHTI